MQLRYYRHSTGNFGDDINAWFWDRIVPNLIDNDPSEILIGLGTILGSWFTDDLPLDSLKIVLGAGAGKQGTKLDFSEGWKIYGVRGPLTAAIYQLDAKCILTDPAMLVRDFEDLRLETRRGVVGFMPHIWSTDRWDWRTFCERLGLEYVDPHSNAIDTIKQISSLERLITEAMHGAIIADAFRTPWIAVSISPAFEGLKWCDWAGSLGLPVFFHAIPDLYDGKEGSLINTTKGLVKRSMTRVGMDITKLSRPHSSAWEVSHAKQRLTLLKSSQNAQLSDIHLQGEAISRVYAAVERLKSDFANRKLA